jgi:hypothetical protein
VVAVKATINNHVALQANGTRTSTEGRLVKIDILRLLRIANAKQYVLPKPHVPGPLPHGYTISLLGLSICFTLQVLIPKLLLD